MTDKSPITIERLREVIAYDPETGLFRWKISRGCRRAGDQTRGCLDPTGYLRIRVDKLIYQAHRLAWFWMTGEWPEDEIDHINRDKIDNRFCNLRKATGSENCRNTPRRSDNASGIKGVCWHKSARKWNAQLNGKSIGVFATIEQAAEAYRQAAKQLHGEFVNHG